MKPLKTITDPEAFQLLADETRRKIVFLLRVKEMTVSQIAAELNITPQAVYHHIKKLQKADLVEVVREERLGHLIESYYRTTAESFNFTVGKAHAQTSRGRKVVIEQTKTALNALKKLGFKPHYTEDQVSRLVDIQAKLEEECKCRKHEDAISELEDLDFPTRLTVAEYAEILSMTDADFKKNIEAKKKLRELLLTLIKN